MWCNALSIGAIADLHKASRLAVPTTAPAIRKPLNTSSICLTRDTRVYRMAAEDLAREIVMLNFAATENSSYLLCNAIMLLAQHPQWLEAIYEEQKQLMEEYGEDNFHRKVCPTRLQNCAVAVLFYNCSWKGELVMYSLKVSSAASIFLWPLRFGPSRMSQFVHTGSVSLTRCSALTTGVYRLCRVQTSQWRAHKRQCALSHPSSCSSGLRMRTPAAVMWPFPRALPLLSPSGRCALQTQPCSTGSPLTSLLCILRSDLS